MRVFKIILGTLILLLLIGIFRFSAQPATQSNQLSTSVTEEIVNSMPVIRDYSEEQKTELVLNWNHIIRKYAHFSLYCLLGIIIAGFSLCFRISMHKRWTATLVFCLIYAVSDELHQLFVPGRGCEFRDMIIDFSGSFLGSLAVFGIALIILKVRNRRERTAL